jgi:AcrR family transcriptional regulator
MRTGRRPGEPGTRDRIADAARRLFAERGFDRTSVRAVAAEAGVDPALVHHYFGTKQRLFIEAVDFPIDAVRSALQLWDDPLVLPRLLGVLRSAVTDPDAGRLLGTLFTRQGPVQLLHALGADQPDLRAELVGTQLVGLAVARHVLLVEPLASADHETIVAAVGPTMQRYLTGDLGAVLPSA